MATTTINLTVLSNGSLVDPTSVDLEDSTDTFGVRRTDTLGLVVAAGTAMTKISTGVYQTSFTEPADDLSYEYAFEIDYLSTTFNRTNTADAGDIINTVILPNTTYYTSQAEVYRLLGIIASELLEDDLAAGDRNAIWDEILQQTTSTLDFYLHQYYTQAALISSDWVRRKATILAANILSSRRGNPQHYRDDVDRAYNELDEVRSGRQTLPRVAEIGYMGPVVRNYELESFRFYHPLRVEKTTSTGDRYPGQDNSWEYPFWF